MRNTIRARNLDPSTKIHERNFSDRQNICVSRVNNDAVLLCAPWLVLTASNMENMLLFAHSPFKCVAAFKKIILRGRVMLMMLTLLNFKSVVYTCRGKCKFHLETRCPACWRLRRKTPPPPKKNKKKQKKNQTNFSKRNNAKKNPTLVSAKYCFVVARAWTAKRMIWWHFNSSSLFARWKPKQAHSLAMACFAKHCVSSRLRFHWMKITKLKGFCAPWGSLVPNQSILCIKKKTACICAFWGNQTGHKQWRI